MPEYVSELASQFGQELPVAGVRFRAGYHHDLLPPAMPMNSLDVATDALALACSDDVISASQLRVRTGSGETIIEGNRAGLLLLASQILGLARSSLAGKHFHLDEASLADAADQSVVFALVTGDGDA